MLVRRLKSFRQAALTSTLAIIVAYVALYRYLFTRDRNQTAQVRDPPLNLKKRMSKLFTSSERPARDGIELCSTAELPYLAPGLDEEHGIGSVRAESATNQHERKTPQNSQRCQELWMTAELPYPEPWCENGRHAHMHKRQDAGDLAPPPRAHIRSCSSRP